MPILVMGAALPLVQCRGRGETPPLQEPQATLERYFASLDRGDAEGWWKLLCAADQSAQPLQESSKAQAQGPKPKHVVKSVKVDGDRATAIVAVTGPEPGAVLNELFKIAKEGRQPSEKDFERISKDDSIPRVTRDQEFKLVNESGGWRVDMGFAALKALMAMSEKVQALEEAGRQEEAEALRGEMERKRVERFGVVDPETQRSLDHSLRKNLALDELGPSLEKVSESMEAVKHETRGHREVVRPPDGLGRSLKRLGPAEYSISADELGQVFAHLDGLGTQIRLVPNRDAQGFNGLKIRSLEPDSLWVRAGLESGDVVERINGKSLGDPETVAGLHETVKTANTITIELVRSQRPMTLTYRVVKMASATVVGP
ncbi:hypothetical protein P2318_10575 [Myxococcaceae bacterium GXIMD 01537]